MPTLCNFVFLRISFGLLSVAASVAALLVLIYFVFIATVDASGVMRLLHIGCILLFLVVIAIDVLLGQRMRRKPGSRGIVAALNNWRAWTVRLVGLPFAGAAAAKMVQTGFASPISATGIAVVGWIAFDVSTVVGAAVQRRARSQRNVTT